MYKYFFTKKGDQKRWFVLFSILVPLIISLIFSAWGIYFSKKSYDLSVDASNNREQIDSMKVMIAEIRTQNRLLIQQIDQVSKLLSINEKSYSTQDSQLTVMTAGLKVTSKPKLEVDPMGGSDLSMDVELINKGGDAYDFKVISTTGLQVSIGLLSQSHIVTSGKKYYLSFTNLKESKHVVKFAFKDNSKIQYSQNLVFYKKDDFWDIQLEPPKELR